MAEIKLKIASVVIGSGEGGGSGVAPYYADLPDKPSINGETLSGEMTSEDLGLASARQSVPSGGTTGQVLAKKSNADNDVRWVNQESGGQGTTDYSDLENKPKINNVTLSGNKTAAQLGLATAAQGEKADTALQQHQDISGKENTSNKVASFQSTPDDTHYPSEKLVKDSLDAKVTMPTGGATDKILEYDATNGVKWADKPQDGKSAYQVAVDKGFVGTQEQWLASLKATIGSFKFVATDATAEDAFSDYGETYASDIDGVSPTQATVSLILLMNDTAGTKTMMIATQEVTPATTPATYEFFYAGDLQSAMPSNVLTEDDVVDNLETNDATKALSAKQGKLIADLSFNLVEGINALNPNQIVVGKYIDKDNGSEENITTGVNCYGHTPMLAMPQEGLCIYHGVNSAGVCWRANIYSTTDLSSFVTSETISSGVLSKTGHDNWNYVIFNLAPLPAGTEASDYYAVYKGSSYPSQFIPYITPYYERKPAVIPDLSITGNKIADNSVTIEKIAEKQIEYLSDNICNPEECYFGNDKYIDKTNGNIDTFTHDQIGGYTGYIPIDAKGVAVSNTYTGGTVIGGAVYYIDSQGNKVFKRTAPVSGIVQYDGGDDSLSESNPLHYPDAYVRFTLYAGASASNVMANKGLTKKTYTPYLGYRKVISKDILPDETNIAQEVIDSNKLFTDAIELHLPNKFYCVRGDTLQLFNKQFGKIIGLENRFVKTTCAVGTLYRRYFEVDSKCEIKVTTYAGIAIGDKYSCNGNVYTVVRNSYGNLTCDFAGTNAMSQTGTLTKISGEGPASTNYTSFAYKAPSVGTYPMNVKVYDDNRNILADVSTQLQVVNSPISPSTQKNILCIGSSTVEGGQWPCELQRRLLANDGNPNGNSITNITLVGNMSKTIRNQTAHFEGHSGWAWSDYATSGKPAFRFYLEGSNNNVVQGNQYTNNGHTYKVFEVFTTEEGGQSVETIKCSTSSTSNTPQSRGTLTPVSGASYPALAYSRVEADSANPFWNYTTGKLDFTTYVNNYCNGAIDIVYIMLGVNNLFDGAIAQEQYVRTFIEALHSEYPNCTIVLVGDAYPSTELMMPGYGASDDRYSDTYKVKYEMVEVFKMYKRLEEEYTTRQEDPIELYYECWAAQVDSDYNFPTKEKAVNTRNSSVTEPYAYNTIHPGDGTSVDSTRGYLQEADAAYRSVVARLCQ